MRFERQVTERILQDVDGVEVGNGGVAAAERKGFKLAFVDLRLVGLIDQDVRFEGL